MRLSTISRTLSTCPICLDDVTALRVVGGREMCQPCAECEVDDLEREAARDDAAREAFGPTAGAHCARCGAMTELVTWRGVVFCASHAAEEVAAEFNAGLDDGFAAHEDAHRAGRI